MAFKCPHCRKSVNDGFPVHSCIEGDKAMADQLRKVWGNGNTATEGTPPEPLTIDKIMAAMENIPKMPYYEGPLPHIIQVGPIQFVISEYLPDGMGMLSAKAARIILGNSNYEEK